MKRVIPLACLLMLAGCVSQRDFNTLKVQVDTLQTRMALMETKNAERQRTVDQALKQQAELQNRYTEMQNQLFTVQGSIDELSASAGLTPAGGGQTRIGLLEKEVKALKEQMQAKAAEAPAPVVQKSLYETALDKFKAGKFEDAVEGFKSYLSHEPDPALTGNAYFWMGESLYALGRFDDAILSYDTVVKRFKDSSKLPDALYKEGLAFMKMGDKETGSIILQQLVKDHPNTDAAQKAKKALANPPAGKG